jgi:hypothetical protein
MLSDLEKKKIVDLLTDKIKQIELAAGHAHALHLQCDNLEAYFNKWEIRRIKLGTRRRRFTAIVFIEKVFYEIPSELFKKALVLGSFP